MNTSNEGLIRSVLRGQRLLIVGGELREQATARLQDELQLAEVVHCATNAHDASPKRFEKHFSDSRFLLVVRLVEFSRTHHGTWVHRACRDRGFPYLDCRAIPHPRRLLAEIERLKLLPALQARRARVERRDPPLGGAA
jgi:hypothetical protein